MKSFNLTSIILCLFVITICHGFEFSMERRNFSLKGKSFCGLLRCHVDNVTDDNVTALIKMDIYYLNNRTLLTTMLSKDSEIQSHTRNTVYTIYTGFEFSMERKNFSLKDKSYCGLLRCHVDNVTEENVTALIKMDIYYLNNRTLLSTMLPKDSEIQSHTGNTVTITGSMSEHHGEFRLYFTDRFDCLEANFICRINFFHVNGQKDFSEKAIVSTSRENDETDLYMKSQISFEHRISDHSGQFLKNLISTNEFLRDRMAFSFQTGNSDHVTADKHSKLPLNSLIETKTKQEPDIDQTLSRLESRLVSMLNVSMTEMFINIRNLIENEKNVNRTAIEMQYIETIVQGSVDSMFLKQDAKLNQMMNKVEVCASRKELTQDNGGYVNMSQIERSLDSISQKRDDLWTSQEMQGEVLANFSSTPVPLKLQEKKLKCERGMNISLSPRVVVSIYNNTKVLCDTKTDGGGWIIIQRRVKGDISFNVGWDLYKQGFGSLQGDFWLGNDVISTLTRTEDYTLRIDLTCEMVDQHAIYSYFKVEDETQLYIPRLGAYSGNVTDRLSNNKDQAFTTLDRDNDKWPDNCANHPNHNSGWWFTQCGFVNLNGVWGSSLKNSIYWDRYKACSFVEMKIRKK